MRQYTEYPDYLAHFGIKGMKWGVRRFQNKDGSYTAAGLKRRFGGGGGGSRSGGKARAGSGTNAEARKAKIKKAAKIAAGAAATAAVAYGGYRLYKSGKGKQLVNTFKSRIDGPKPVLGLPQKEKMELSIHRKSIRPKRSRTAKEALEYAHRLKTPKSKRGRTAKEAIEYLDRMHKTKSQQRGSTSNISYEELKKKYDRFSKAVSDQQDFLNGTKKRKR